MEHGVEAARLTRLDRMLIGLAEQGVIDLRADAARDDPGTNFERAEGARRASEVEDINGKLMRPAFGTSQRRDYEIGLSLEPLQIAHRAT